MKTEQETHFLTRKITENSCVEILQMTNLSPSIWHFHALLTKTKQKQTKKAIRIIYQSFYISKDGSSIPVAVLRKCFSWTERVKKSLPVHKENVSYGNCSCRPSKTKLKTPTDLQKYNLKSSKTSYWTLTTQQFAPLDIPRMKDFPGHPIPLLPPKHRFKHSKDMDGTCTTHVWTIWPKELQTPQGMWQLSSQADFSLMRSGTVLYAYRFTMCLVLSTLACNKTTYMWGNIDCTIEA